MSTMNALHKVVNGESLLRAEMRAVVTEIMNGQWSPPQIAALLTALRMKGETVEELTGAAEAMRRKAFQVPLESPTALDTCGTGGDGANTFNISTTVAFVAAAAGAFVAKHGNRSVSSRSGSADVLESLGVHIHLSPEKTGQCVDEVGLGFLFAPAHHPAMKHAAPIRRELGFRTLFNLVGPLTNPAGATHQLMGIFDGASVEKIALVLRDLGSKRALVVHGSDGLDELTLSGPTSCAFLTDGAVQTFEILPTELGIPLAPLSELRGGDSVENAQITRGILEGLVQGPKRDVVLLNAAAALLVAEKVENWNDGLQLAQAVINDGSALHKLDHLIRWTQENR